MSNVTISIEIKGNRDQFTKVNISIDPDGNIEVNNKDEKAGVVLSTPVPHPRTEPRVDIDNYIESSVREEEPEAFQGGSMTLSQLNNL